MGKPGFRGLLERVGDGSVSYCTLMYKMVSRNGRIRSSSHDTSCPALICATLKSVEVAE